MNEYETANHATPGNLFLSVGWSGLASRDERGPQAALIRPARFVMGAIEKTAIGGTANSLTTGTSQRNLF